MNTIIESPEFKRNFSMISVHTTNKMFGQKGDFSIMDKEQDKTTKNGDEPSGKKHYGNETSGQNRYGDGPPEGSDDRYTNPTGEDHLVWVTPPVLLSEVDGQKPDFAGGI